MEQSHLSNRSRRLRVVFIAGLLESGGALALLIDLGHGEIHESRVQRCTVLVFCIQRNHRGIAGIQLLKLFPLKLDGSDTRGTIERLTNGI